MIRVNGLYGHIRRNALKSVLLLSCFVGLVALFWTAWCLIYGVLYTYAHPSAYFASEFTLPNEPPQPHPVAFPASDGISVGGMLLFGLETAWRHLWVAPLLAAGWFVFAYFVHDNLVDAATGSTRVNRIREPQLYNLVENLAITAGLPTPRVKIIETEELNAYASGRTPATASIGVTRGLLNTLDAAELEAVLAHEITHIVNYDVTFMAIATVFAGGLTMVGGWVVSRFTGTRKVNLARVLVNPAGLVFAAAGLLFAFVYLFAILTRFAISRSREFMADAGSVELCKRPEALASALLKIKDRAEIPGVAPAMMAMMICGGSTGWFDTHPSIEDRVAALRKYAGMTGMRRRGLARPTPDEPRPFGRRGARTA